VLLDLYNRVFQKSYDEIQTLKLKIYEAFSVKHKHNKNAELAINSEILKNPVVSQEQLQFLNTILNGPKKVELLFRASEHQFKIAAFHKQCDGIPNTLTLVRTEFGRTIGGFSSIPWDSNNSWGHDPNARCFLFSLDFQEKYSPARVDRLIYRRADYGPYFGGGNEGSDLCLWDECNKNSISYANFPCVYGREKYASGQESIRLFSGQVNGWNFRVEEYEVFRVVSQ
jgi:hypothetical protein